MHTSQNPTQATNPVSDDYRALFALADIELRILDTEAAETVADYTKYLLEARDKEGLLDGIEVFEDGVEIAILSAEGGTLHAQQFETDVRYADAVDGYLFKPLPGMTCQKIIEAHRSSLQKNLIAAGFLVADRLVQELKYDVRAPKNIETLKNVWKGYRP